MYVRYVGVGEGVCERVCGCMWMYVRVYVVVCGFMWCSV